jgi:hypothetical protein
MTVFRVPRSKDFCQEKKYRARAGTAGCLCTTHDGVAPVPGTGAQKRNRRGLAPATPRRGRGDWPCHPPSPVLGVRLSYSPGATPPPYQAKASAVTVTGTVPRNRKPLPAEEVRATGNGMRLREGTAPVMVTAGRLCRVWGGGGKLRAGAIMAPCMGAIMRRP